MSLSKPRYRAFISYSHRDAKWAKWLHRSLERYVVPIDAFTENERLEKDGSEKSRRLTPIFRDRDELPASGSLSGTIQQALESSENLIVLCSPSSAASQYVNAEIETFRGLRPDNGNKIYALIIEGEPPECFPPELIAGKAEPIAADAREEGDGKADAKLKLIAGMLGVGFDRLKQREVKRQRNRLLAMVSVVSAVAVMTSVLALWAVKAEREAIKQKELAEERRIQAEQSARESKAVLGFYNSKVVGSAKSKAEPGGLGIDVTLRDAIDAAEPQIEKAFVDQTLIEASIRKAIGDAYSSMSDHDAAIPQFERALELRKQELGSEHYDTLGAMMVLAGAYMGVNRGADSLALNEELVKLAKKTLGDEHSFTQLSLRKLTGTYLRTGRVNDAIPINEELLLQRSKKLGPKHKDTLQSMHDTAVSYRIADRYEESINLHKETLGLRAKVLGPEHVDTQSSVSELSNTYSDMGNHEEALKFRQEALRLSRVLHGPLHPRTLHHMRAVSSSYSKLGRHNDGISLLEEVLRLQKEILGSGHLYTIFAMRDLAYSYQRVGELEKAENQYKELVETGSSLALKDWTYYYDQLRLGSLLIRNKKYTEAEPFLLSAKNGLQAETKKIRRNAYKSTLAQLVGLYQAWGKLNKVAEWQMKLDDLEKAKK